MFNIGDRVMVQLPDDLPDQNLRYFSEAYERYFSKVYEEGEYGIVLDINPISGLVGVIFDDYNEARHDLCGACDDGYGYWVYEKFLVLEEPDLDYKPVDLDEILEVY